MEKYKIVASGRTMAYVEKGKGPTVLLLHGFCGSSSYWDALLPLLPDDHRWISPDLRGHGASAAPEGPYTMEALADDIAVFLQELRVEKVTLLGHSLGGYITLAFAERYPERLNGFGLIHSTAIPDDEKGKEGRLNGMKTIKEQGLPVFIDGLIPKLFAPSHVETMPEKIKWAKQIGCGTNPDGAARTLEGMRTRPDRNAVLAAARVPVLLVAGEHDQIIPRERAFSVTAPHISQKLIAGAGHMSMVEAPAQLAETILGFV